MSKDISFADEALNSLKQQGVDLSYCKSPPDTATGLALIVVTEGRNARFLSPGINQDNEQFLEH